MVNEILTGEKAGWEPARAAVHRDCSSRESFAIARRLLRRRAKAGSSDLARRRARQFVRRTPACHPVLHVVQRHGRAGPIERVEPPAVLRDVGTGDIDHGIEQRHRFREHPRDFLSALVRHLAQAHIGAGVDIQRARKDNCRGAICRGGLGAAAAASPDRSLKAAGYGLIKCTVTATRPG